MSNVESDIARLSRVAREINVADEVLLVVTEGRGTRIGCGGFWWSGPSDRMDDGPKRQEQILAGSAADRIAAAVRAANTDDARWLFERLGFRFV